MFSEDERADFLSVGAHENGSSRLLILVYPVALHWYVSKVLLLVKTGTNTFSCSRESNLRRRESIRFSNDDFLDTIEARRGDLFGQG